MTNIFLGGGGSAIDSLPLDQHFANLLDKQKLLVYIPNAMTSRPFSECMEWFTHTFAPLGVNRIEMWDRLQPQADVSEIAGIYVGGGDTGRLLKLIRESHFSEYIVEAVKSGVPVYGGSAGAIVLGRDIRTAPEAVNLSLQDATGLGLLADECVACHYVPERETSVCHAVSSLGYSIIAIPEKSGLYYNGQVYSVFGTESAWLFSMDEKKELLSGESYTL